VKCIIDREVVLSRAPEGSFAAQVGPFARSPSEQRYTLGSIQQSTPRLSEQPVDRTRLCRAMSGGFARRDLKSPIQIRGGSPLQDIVRKGR
jgi:hypothetical protein